MTINCFKAAAAIFPSSSHAITPYPIPSPSHPITASHPIPRQAFRRQPARFARRLQTRSPDVNVRRRVHARPPLRSIGNHGAHRVPRQPQGKGCREARRTPEAHKRDCEGCKVHCRPTFLTSKSLSRDSVARNVLTSFCSTFPFPTGRSHICIYWIKTNRNWRRARAAMWEAKE